MKSNESSGIICYYTIILIKEKASVPCSILRLYDNKTRDQLHYKASLFQVTADRLRLSGIIHTLPDLLNNFISFSD